MAERARAARPRRRLRRRWLGWAAVLVGVDLGVVVGLLAHGVSDSGLVLRGGVLWLGAVGLALLARLVGSLAADVGRSPAVGGPPPEPSRPEGLEELSRLVDSCRSASADRVQFTDRLRPLLLQLAASRLGRPLPARRLRAELGERTAALLLDAGPAEASAFPATATPGGNGRAPTGSRGPSLAELEAVAAALEGLG